jgi:hypothetical protein
MNFYLIFGAQLNSKIIAHQFVIKEILFYHLPFIAKAQNKVLISKASVCFHYMPEYRPAADLDQRFWSVFRSFGKPDSPAAAKNDNLHNHLPVLLI